MRGTFRLITILLLFVLIGNTAKAQMPLWKKQVLIGSAYTIGGAGTLAAGSYMLAVSVPAFFADNDDHEEVTAAAAGLLAGGCILAVAGATFTAYGPVIISHGVKAKRNPETPVSMRFTPIQDKLLDRYQCSMNSKKFATVAIVF